MDYTTRVMVAALGQAVKDKDAAWCSTTGRDWCAIMGWRIDPMRLLRASQRSRKGRHDRKG